MSNEVKPLDEELKDYLAEAQEKARERFGLNILSRVYSHLRRQLSDSRCTIIGATFSYSPLDEGIKDTYNLLTNTLIDLENHVTEHFGVERFYLDGVRNQFLGETEDTSSLRLVG